MQKEADQAPAKPVGSAKESCPVPRLLLRLVRVDDHFAPNTEKLDIVYELIGFAGKVVKLEISSQHYGGLLFERELSAKEKSDGTHTFRWDGKCQIGSLKDKYIHPLFSPYKVHLYHDGKYTGELPFKVLYHSIELKHGPWTPDEKEPEEGDEKAWVQYKLNELGYHAGPVGKDTADYLKKAVIRYKANHVKFRKKYAPAYSATITPELKAALKAKENDRKLGRPAAIEDSSKKSNICVEELTYEKLSATTDEFGDTRPPHEKKRVNRPLIPVEALIYIKTKSDSKVLEPEAVGPARINWRCLDPDEDLSRQYEPTAAEPSQTKKYVEKALKQKNGRTGTNGDNCPKAFGGIRTEPATNYRPPFFLGDVYVPYTAQDDKGNKTVFTIACLDKDKFPKRFGRAGILLRPSYIAGDDYQYTVELGFEGLPNKAELEKLHGITADEKTKIKARTGVLTIRRFNRVAMSIDWPARSGSYEWDKIATDFEKCFLDVDVKSIQVKKLSDVLTADEYKQIVAKYTKHKSKGKITLFDDAMVGVDIPPQGSRNADQYKKFLKKFCHTQYNDRIQTPLGDKLSEIVRKTDATGFVVLNFLLHKPIDIKTDPKKGKHDVTAANLGYITWGGSIGLADSIILLDQKDPDKVYYVVAHEMGHNLYLLHWENTGESNFANHDRNDHNCTMSYSDFSFKKAKHFKHHEPGVYAPHFCGKCNLAVRGWDITIAGMKSKSKKDLEAEHATGERHPEEAAELASVTVEVVNEKGKPVSGAEVELVGLRKRNTDAGGKVKYSELDPGEVDLKVRKTNYGPTPPSGQPWVVREHQQYKILRSGSNSFRVVMIKKTARLLVKVQAGDGKPVDKAEVEIVGIHKKNTGKDGKADFGEMAAGTYDIKVRKTGYGPLPAGGAPWVAGEHQEYRKLEAGDEAPVIVKMTGNAGYLAVVVKSPASQGGKAIEKTEVELVGVNKKNTGKDGKADFGEVPAGRYDIKVRKTSYGPAPGAGAQFVAGEFQVYKQVDVGKSVSVPVEMVQGIGTLTVTVQTPDGKPIEKAEVELVGYAKKNTNAKGEAVFTSLEARTYDIKTRKKGYGNKADPVNFSEDREVRFVDPGKNTKVNLVLARSTAFLQVVVKKPTGEAIDNVEVELVDVTKKPTGSNGIADFGEMPIGKYDVKARKLAYGPEPRPGEVFQFGEARPRDAAGNVELVEIKNGEKKTATLKMMTPVSVTVKHTPANASHKERIYKSGATADQEILAIVKLPLTRGTGPGTQAGIEVEWSFTADGGNAPKANGGKDNTDIHFVAVAGHPVTGGNMLTTAKTVTDGAGETKITFSASGIAGDKFTVHVKVFGPPGNTVHGSADSVQFEVWKLLDYRGLYRMVTGANKGVDVGALCVEGNIQPAYTPAFTEYRKGPVTNIAFQPFVSDLMMPTAAQLPTSSQVRVRSDGPDTRRVTIEGLIVAADGSTSNGSEVLTLAGTGTVAGAANFQRVTRTVVATDPARTVTVESAGGAAIGTIPPGAGSAAFNFLFDTAASVQAKAQAWANANEAKYPADLATLNGSIAAAGYLLVGCGLLHPKHSGHASGRTTFYTGYPGVTVTVAGVAFHPDALWNEYDGMNQGQMSCLFTNVLKGGPLGGPYTKGVARHEIGHASDHVSFGAGDHCPQAANVCLMNANSTAGDFCTIAPDHSRHKVMGWT
ncbi:MAG: carboxypeptidase-like regulatory domain-containing protein [Acidobacteriota bacterium]